MDSDSPRSQATESQAVAATSNSVPMTPQLSTPAQCRTPSSTWKLLTSLSSGLGQGLSSFSIDNSTESGHTMGTPSSNAARRLSESVSGDLLRAVDLHDALQGFGRYLKGSITGGTGVDEAAQHGFEHAKQVEVIDEFWSHDWGTGRMIKCSALLCFYNSQSAIMASIGLALLLFLLDLTGQLGPEIRFISVNNVVGTRTVAMNSNWTMVLCPLLLFGIIFFGQRIRQLFPFLPSRRVFLDKMCINQTKEEEKAEAISCLAGFLKRTKRMVVLWSPQYLTRLWCVYEIATWLHQGRNFQQDVDFVPVSLFAGLLVSTLGLYVFFLLNILVLGHLEAVAITGAQLGVITLGICFPLHFLRKMVWDLGRLKQQLAEFRVQDSHCYCCTKAHKCPKTGADIPCDRELVYQTLSTWFSTDSEGGSDVSACLESFNTFVHERVEPAVSAHILSAWSRYKMCMLIMLPGLWYNAQGSGTIRVLADAPDHVVPIALWTAELLVGGFLLYPCFAMIALRLCSISNRLGGPASLKFGVRDVLCIVFIIVGTLFSVLVLEAALSSTRGLASPWPFAGALVVDALVSLFMFCWPWQP